MENQEKPQWLCGRTLNEVRFCREFVSKHPMVYVDGAFFTEEGRIPQEDMLRTMIYDQLRQHMVSGLHGKIDGILAVLRLECWRDKLPASVDRIHVKNGTYLLPDGYHPQKDLCRYRLPVAFNEDAPEPRLWLSFLNDLLEPEDIDTLQEYMGYCLIPTNAGQKMLIITGKGGEGKSRIGKVMHSLLGDNMKNGSLDKVENNKFARADLEHTLLMVDDDLKMEALSQTSYIKSLVTADLPMDLERKGLQSYQGNMHVRFMAFGNGTLQAIHDHSRGFFRRQIILCTKEKPKDRVDDPYLSERLEDEMEGIFLWALTGLFRLIGNDFRFTISPRARQNMYDAVSDNNNVVEFMNSKGYFLFDPQGTVTSRALFNTYRDWCEDNVHIPVSGKVFWSFLQSHANGYGLRFSRSIPIGNERYARGFKGIRLCSRF